MYVLFMGFKSLFLCRTEYSCLIVMLVQIEGQIVSFLHSFISYIQIAGRPCHAVFTDNALLIFAPSEFGDL